MRQYHHHHPAVLHQRKFDRLLARLQARLPDRAGRAMAWLISPAASLLRLPLAVLFIFGGVFSFLPVLGVWMLPLGILLIAVDVALVRRWVVKTWPWVESRWRLRSRRKRMRQRMHWRRPLADGAQGSAAPPPPTRATSSAQISTPK